MRRILITGGTRGIGRSCVERFCKNGDDVTFFYRSSEHEAAGLSASCGATGVRVDVADGAVVARSVAEAYERMGGIDVLVNNAGIAHKGLFTDMTDADWRRICDVNLSGQIYVGRETARYMIRRQSGCIVNLGSVWGRAGASCEVTYSATKAGVRGFTRALAKELGPSGIRVNCVEPGVIDTDMNRELDAATMSDLCNETPLGRIGTPADVAEAVFFLASDSAAFITGQIIGVDGGFGI